MKLVSTKFTDPVPVEQFNHKPMVMHDGGLLRLKETTIIHSHRFVMELLQCLKVCEIGGDELHRPPVVALS